jgi:hypothetical protein
MIWVAAYRKGSISACAGSPVTQAGGTTQAKVYPRVGGVTCVTSLRRIESTCKMAEGRGKGKRAHARCRRGRLHPFTLSQSRGAPLPRGSICLGREDGQASHNRCDAHKSPTRWRYRSVATVKQSPALELPMFAHIAI